jgi:hypothetical protein
MRRCHDKCASAFESGRGCFDVIRCFQRGSRLVMNAAF